MPSRRTARLPVLRAGRPQAPPWLRRRRPDKLARPAAATVARRPAATAAPGGGDRAGLHA